MTLDIELLESTAATISKILGTPDLKGDIMSTLYEMMVENPNLNVSPDNRRLVREISKAIGADVSFKEINESSLIKNEDQEDMPTVLDLHSDETTPETILLQAIGAEREAEDAEIRKVMAHAKILAMEPHMNRKEERALHLVYGLGYSIDEAAEFCQCHPRTVKRIIDNYQRKNLFTDLDDLKPIFIDWVKF